MAESTPSCSTSGGSDKSSNIQVTVKVRPLIKREKDAKMTKLWRVKENSIQLVEPATNSNEGFTFDHIFDEETSTADMFNKIAKPIVGATLKGFNGTIFAYGQTSSGKTHTMLGDDSNPGIMILAVREIFNEIEILRDRQFLLRVGYIEIYNEKLYDLLDINTEPKILEKTRGETNVSSKEFMVSNEETIMELLLRGNKERKTAGTKMNERSSRSHTIFRLIIESSLNDNQTNDDERVVQTSYLNLVDLAGSERAVQTGATGSRLIEAGNINKSLLSLSLVISQLAEQSDPESFVNYRNSKLTRILAASLGGNAMTAIICNVTPAAHEETASTLNFAMSAKKVKNKPQVNEICSETVFMKRLMREITRLNEELASAKLQTSEQVHLQARLLERESHILRAKPTQNPLRRRTWAPSLTSSDPAMHLFNSHVSRIPPPGHRTQHMQAAVTQSSLKTTLPVPAFVEAGDTLQFDEDGIANSSSTFDNTLTPPKFESLRMVSNARGSAMQPPKLPRPVPTPAAERPALPRPCITLETTSGSKTTVLASSSPATISRVLSTPSDLQHKQQRYKSRDSHSPCTPGRKIIQLEKDLTDLQNFTRLESGMAQIDGGGGDTDNEQSVLRQRVLDMQAELEARQSEHEELIMYRAGLMSNATETSVDERIAAALSEANAEVEHLTITLTSCRQQISAAETAHRDVLQTVRNQLDASKATHQRQLDDLTADVRRQADEHRLQLAKAAAEATAARKAAEHAQSLQTSIEYEYEQFRVNAKRREQELADRLDEQRQPDVQLQTVANLKEALKRAESTLWAHEERIKEMAESSAALSVQLTEQQAELSAARADVDRQRQTAEAAATAVQQQHRSAELVWQSELAALQQQLTNLSVANGEQLQLVQAKCQAEEAWQMVQAELTKKVTSLSDTNQSLQAQLQARVNDAQTVAKTLAQTEQRQQQLEQQVAELTERVAISDNSLVTLQSKLDDALGHCKQAQQERENDLAVHRSAEQTWLSERSELELKCTAIADRLTNATEQSDGEQHTLQSQLVAERNALAQHQQAWQTDRSALEQSNVRLAERLASAQSALETMHADHRQVQSDYEVLSQQLIDAVQDSADLDTMRIEHARLTAALATLENTSSKYQQQVVTLESQLREGASSHAISAQATGAMAVLLNYQIACVEDAVAANADLTTGKKTASALVSSIAKHCLSETADSDATLLQLHDAILVEFDNQLGQIHDLHQQVDDQATHFDQMELQMDAKVFELQQLINETDQRLGDISAQYANRAAAATSGEVSLRELHALHEQYAVAQQQLREAEALNARLEQQHHEVQSDRDENQKAFEETIAQKLDLDERCGAQREQLRELAELASGRQHELAAALQRLAVAEDLLAKLQQDYDADQLRIAELRAEQSTVAVELERLRMRELRLEEELIASQAERQRTADELVASEAELRKVQNDCTNLGAQLAAAGLGAEDLQRQLMAITAEKNALEAVVENDRSVIEQAEQECRSMRDTMHDTMLAMANSERLQEERDAYRADNAKLMADLQSSEQTKRLHVEQLAELSEKLAAVESNRSELTEQMSHELDEKWQAAEQRLLAMRMENVTLNEQLVAANAVAGLAVERLDELQRLKEVHDTLRAEFDQVRAALAAELIAKAEALQKYSASVETLTADNETLRQQIVMQTTEFSEQIAVLKRSNEHHLSIAGQHTELNALNCKLLSEIDQVKVSLHDRTRECSQLRLQLDERQVAAIARADAAESVAELTRQLNELQHQNTVLRTTGEHLQSKLAAAGDEFVRSSAEHSAAVEQLNIQAGRQSEQLQQAIEAHRAVSAELSDLRGRQRSERSFHEKELKISELESHLQHLCKEDQAHRQQNDALQSRNQQMFTELSDLRARIDRDRKSRRRSAHDDSRTTFTTQPTQPQPQPDVTAGMGLTKALVRSTETQTGDAAEPCGCVEMDKRIKILQRDMKIKDCHLARLKMEMEHHPLVADNAELKKLVAKHEKNVDTLNARLAELTAIKVKPSAVAACNCSKSSTSTSTQSNTAAPSRVHREQQTDEFKVINGSALIAQQEQDKANDELVSLANKYRQAKWLCQKRKEEIDRLEQKLIESAAAAAAQRISNGDSIHGGGNVSTAKLADRMEKENALANSSNRLQSPPMAEQKLIADFRRLESENLSLRSEVQALQTKSAGISQQTSQYNVSEEDRLKAIIDELETENKIVRQKYDGLKVVLVARNRQVQFLEAERVAHKKVAEN